MEVYSDLLVTLRVSPNPLKSIVSHTLCMYAQGLVSQKLANQYYTRTGN